MTHALIVSASLIYFLIVYHHLGYPLLLRTLGRRTLKKVLKVPVRNYVNRDKDDLYPSVTIVVPAFNEQVWIESKIHNLAALDYPHDKLNIIIACDGCSDKTALSPEM